jgi:hypothetical protein
MGNLEGILIGLIVLSSLAAGALSGSSAYDDAWKKDCEQTGVHRTSNGIYDCMKRLDVLKVGGK